MNGQQRNELLRVILPCTGPFAFLLALSLLTPRVSAAAGAKPGAGASSSQGGQNTSSSQSPQTPTIPLDLPVFAYCTKEVPAKPECGTAPPIPPDCKNTSITRSSANASPWTAEENCQLTHLYNQNKWKQLQTLLLNFICNLKCDLPHHAYYSVVFLNEDLPAPTLSRVLVHDDPQPEIYGSRVGGYDLYDLQLLPDFGISVRTTYQATTAPNGVIAQLPGVLAQVATGAKNIPTPGPPSSGNGTSKMIVDAISKIKDSENKIRAAPSETVIQENLMQIEQIKDSGLINEAAIKPLQEQLATDRATSNQSQAIDSKAIMKNPELVKNLIDADSKITALLETHREFVIRHVKTPRTFNRGGLRTASVIPQVSVTDQLAFSPALEEYLLSSLSLRATTDDELLKSHYSHQQTQPASDVNKQLAEKYKKCRSDAQQAPQLTVTADHTAYTTTGGNVTLTAQLSDTNNSSYSALLQVKFTSYPIGIPGAKPVDCSSTKSSPQVWLGTCLINSMPPGPYLIEATASDPGAASGSAPVAKADTALVVTDSTSTGSLILAERMPAWGVALNANFTLDVGAMTNPVHAVVRTFSAQELDRGKELWTSPTASAQPVSGIAEGSVKLDTGTLGGGERLAVLTADLGSGYKSFAAVNFTVGSRGAPPQAASGSSGGSSSNCNFNLSIKPSGDGLTETQEFALYQADLATTYTSLFAFSNPGQQPSAPPAPIQYTFGKLTRWSYSLGVGGMFPAFYNPPAKVSSTGNRFVHDSQSQALTFVAADYHPLRYDETEFSPSTGERLRFLGGIALTPSIGFVVGVGGELFRGFSLETGCSILLENVLPSGASFTAAPSNSPNLKTRRGFAVAPFLAIGYSLQ